MNGLLKNRFFPLFLENNISEFNPAGFINELKNCEFCIRKDYLTEKLRGASLSDKTAKNIHGTFIHCINDAIHGNVFCFAFA